jgi:hypothetical protein
MRVEQERIRLLARLEEVMDQRDSVFRSPFAHLIQTHLTGGGLQGNISGSSLDGYIHHSEHVTSPPSSSGSTKIGSASVDKPSTKRRRLEAIPIPNVEKPQKAPGPRKSAGRPPAGGTKAQTKTAASTSRSAKDKGTSKQKPTQNKEEPVSKGPTQRLIRRVHAVVEVPIKVEDEEEEVGDPPDDGRKGRVPSDTYAKSSTAAKKATKSTELSRTKTKALPAHGDEDVTPSASAHIPKRRKSGIERDYYEPDEDTHGLENREDVNARRRPPSRRKSIRELRESDFEYREEEEDQESDTDELNLGVGLHFVVFSGVLIPSSRGVLNMLLIWRNPRSDNGRTKRRGAPQRRPGGRGKWMLWMLTSPW